MDISNSLYLSGQPILNINKQNQAIYTVQQPIKIHLRSPGSIATANELAGIESLTDHIWLK